MTRFTDLVLAAALCLTAQGAINSCPEPEVLIFYRDVNSPDPRLRNANKIDMHWPSYCEKCVGLGFNHCTQDAAGNWQVLINGVSFPALSSGYPTTGTPTQPTTKYKTTVTSAQVVAGFTGTTPATSVTYTAYPGKRWTVVQGTTANPDAHGYCETDLVGNKIRAVFKINPAAAAYTFGAYTKKPTVSSVTLGTQTVSCKISSVL